MRLNPSSTVRATLYVVSIFINAVMGVMIANEVVMPVFVLALLAGFNAVVAVMAGANVTSDR
jgi:hypothetical protein